MVKTMAKTNKKNTKKRPKEDVPVVKECNKQYYYGYDDELKKCWRVDASDPLAG